MRLLHPTTIKILSSHPELPKTHLAHAWAEVFKWKASGQKHPKMFIDCEEDLGNYLAYIYEMVDGKGYNLDSNKINKLSNNIKRGWDLYFLWNKKRMFKPYFDSNYLFSDACSLYFKGVNIFKDIFGDQWTKYCPVINLKEINRQISKTLNKK